MKLSFLLISLSFTFSFVFGQLQDLELCKDVFQNEKLDSTYIHFYVLEKDTVYFSNDRCVYFPQPASPRGYILWMIKGGAAKGEITFSLTWKEKNLIVSGTFVEGVFHEGLWLTYHKNGRLNSSVHYLNSIPFGEHLIYHEAGSLTHRCIKDENGLCPPEIHIKKKQ